MLEPDFENNSSFPVKALMSATKEAVSLQSQKRNKESSRFRPKKVRFAMPLTVDLVAEAKAKEDNTQVNKHVGRPFVLSLTSCKALRERACANLITNCTCANKR